MAYFTQQELYQKLLTDLTNLDKSKKNLTTTVKIVVRVWAVYFFCNTVYWQEYLVIGE